MFWRRSAKQTKELHARVEKIERALEQLANKNMEYTVNIEHLHAHNPVLEQLTFRLDQLDIKTVSGALNLGNNFGVRIIQDSEQSHSTTSESSDEEETDDHDEQKTGDKQELRNTVKSQHVDGGRMEETAYGYRFKFENNT